MNAILPHLATLFGRIDFLSEERKFLKTNIYFCSLSNGGSNDVRISRKALETNDYIGLRQQEVSLSPDAPNRFHCEKQKQ